MKRGGGEGRKLFCNRTKRGKLLVIRVDFNSLFIVYAIRITATKVHYSCCCKEIESNRKSKKYAGCMEKLIPIHNFAAFPFSANGSVTLVTESFLVV